MSEYNNAADKADSQLKRISPTMCFAKWAQVSIHLTNGLNNSCYHPPLHKVNLDLIKKNPSALHNTDEKKLERKMMLHGERPPGCSYCWRIEDSGARSDRIYRSGEYWAQNARKDIIASLDTGDIDPRYVEVNFNQACNFKCMYCSPHLSTTWEEEIKEHGPYLVVDNNNRMTKHNDTEYLAKEGMMPLKVKQDENPYLNAFWEWWPKLYRKLEVFRITGGEPLMDANTFKVLDYIFQNPNSWLEVSITTNLCPPKDELMDRFIRKVKRLEQIQIWEDKERWNPGSGNHWYVNMALKNFAVFVSLDSVGKQAEYIRSGLDFNKMDENVNKFLTETVNSTLTFINTFNALSVPNFINFLKYVLDLRRKFSRSNQGIKHIPIHDQWHTHPDYEILPRQRIWFDIPLLRYPDWQAVHILPAELDSIMEQAIEFMKQNSNVENFEGFYDFEIAKAERNLSIMRERKHLDTAKIEIDRQNMARYFEQYDERKGTDFVETFPELAQFYKKYLAQL